MNLVAGFFGGISEKPVKAAHTIYGVQGGCKTLPVVYPVKVCQTAAVAWLVLFACAACLRGARKVGNALQALSDVCLSQETQCWRCFQTLLPGKTACGGGLMSTGHRSDAFEKCQRWTFRVASNRPWSQLFFKRLRENTVEKIPGFSAEATNPCQRQGLLFDQVQCVRDPQGTKSDTAGPVRDTGLAVLRIARTQICLPPGPQAQCLWSRCCSHCALGSAMRLRARHGHHN